MRFNNVNCSELIQLYFHDSELRTITVDYKAQSAMILLSYPGYYSAKLLFRNVKYVLVPINEPWAGGFYVSNVKSKSLNDDSRFETSILLNSGDEVAVVATELSVEGYEDSRSRLSE